MPDEKKESIRMVELKDEDLGVCPACHQDINLDGKSGITLELATQDLHRALEIPVKLLHGEFVTGDVPYSCSRCGWMFAVQFRIHRIFMREQGYLGMTPPKPQEVKLAINKRKLQAKREAALRENGVGDERDQDKTEQGKV